MFSLDQYSSVVGQKFYFNDQSPSAEIDKKIANNDLDGVRDLMTRAKADKAMIVASMCNKGPIFDHLFENYTAKMDTRGTCIENFALFGDKGRIVQILKKGQVEKKSMQNALWHAVKEGHDSLAYELAHFKLTKRAFQDCSNLAKEQGKNDLASYLSNRSQDAD